MARLIHPSAILNAETVTLGDLLDMNTFVIPDYQRDFSWGEEELEKLWDDVIATLERSFINGKVRSKPDGHFLGAIVTHRPAAGGSLEIIDGQQRLTTISMAISVLLEFCDKIADQARRDNLKMQLLPLIANSHGGGRDARLILAREQTFYDESVVQRNTMAARNDYWKSINLDKEPVKRRIKNAISELYKDVVGVVYDGGELNETSIANLADIFTELLLVLSLEVIDHRMAYLVFETLNFRGLELSQADLVKNELVRRAEQQGSREDVVANWTDTAKILDGIPNFSLVEFLQLHFASKYGPVRASELFESVVEHLDQTSLSALNYTKDLLEEGARLSRLVEGDNATWSNDANRALDDIRDSFGLHFAYPLLMAAAARYVNAAPSFDKWAIRVKNFCFRHYLIQRSGLSSFERVVTDAARSLRSQETKEEDVINLLQSASPDAVFADKFKGATVSTNKLGFYVIKSIEDYLSDGSGTTLPQGPAQHLEHIMPKKPGSGWSHIANDPRYSSYLMRIGNLLGLEQKINSHIKNRSFDYKYSNVTDLDYVHSKMAMPSETNAYLTNGKWDFDSIDKRQAHLAMHLAPLVWPLS